MAKLYGRDAKLPNYARPEYVALEPDLELIADELGGTRAMHARSTKYIRKWSAEKLANYNIRRLCETFFEGLGRTLSAAVGMLFAKPPTMEWNQGEELMAPHWDNIDGAGTSGPVFVKRFAESSIAGGLAVILVDHPTPPEGEVTGETEVALNLRPMWRRYDRSQAINWLVEVVNNEATVTQLTLVEHAAVRQEGFGVKNVVRFRDLRLVEVGGQRVAMWTLREQVDEAGTNEQSFRPIGNGVFRNRAGDLADRLPVAIGYTGRSDAPMDATIPLLGVAWANLAHWQVSTSLRFNSEVAGFAQPVVIGDLVPDPTTGDPRSLEIGPLVSVQVGAGGDFKWAEPAGTGLDRLGLLALEKLRQIAAQGMSFLQTDTRSAETAEAKRLDAAAENATLATAASGIEDATNHALTVHAWFLGVAKEVAPKVTLSRDFEDTTIQADVMNAYTEAMKEGAPVRLWLEAWQRGGRISPDADLDKLEMEMMANAEAAARQREEDALMRRTDENLDEAAD